MNSVPIRVAARSKAWVCGSSLAGIARSNRGGKGIQETHLYYAKDTSCCGGPAARDANCEIVTKSRLENNLEEFKGSSNN